MSTRDVATRCANPVPRARGTRRRLVGSGLALVLVTCPWAASADIVQCRDAHGVVLMSPGGAESACRDASAKTPDRPGGRATANVATPANFPRVDPTVQRRRDDDRALILRDELESEQARLKQLEADFLDSRAIAGPHAPMDRRLQVPDVVAQIARTRQNVLAIQREISGLR